MTHIVALFYYLFVYFCDMEIEPRVLWMMGKHSVTELHPPALLVLCLFETRSHYLAQSGLELMEILLT